ncbi:hypothetical protein MBLNU230_g3545t1 [Neophaeotheca triangularis]
MSVQSKRATKHRHHVQTAPTHNDPNSNIGSQIIGLQLETIYLQSPILPIPGSLAEILQLPHHHPQGYRERVGSRSCEARKNDSNVLSTLLNDIRAQERQSRVCAAIAIGEAAETCQPFTVLSVRMKDYRLPELHDQVASLEALSFLFEYIGEMDKDYVYAVIPLLKDALTGCIQAHRQTAAVVVKHIALGMLLHLLSLLIPSLFEAYRPLRILAFGPPTERFYRNAYMAVNRAPSCHVTPLVLPVRMALARTTSTFSAIYLPAYNHLKRDYFRSAGCRIL